jgi:hypothetical protein
LTFLLSTYAQKTQSVTDARSLVRPLRQMGVC